jgi:ADP-ribose pyrophosphatase YjhB (NUDIX family)
MLETPSECAIREVLEETSLEINNIRDGPWVNTFFSNDKHYITIFMISDYLKGEPKVY